MEIDCGICKIRSWRAGDAEAIVRHGDNPKVSAHLRDRFPNPYTPEKAHEWLDKTVGKEPESLFAIEYEGEAVGGIGLILGTDIERVNAELGYRLGETVWGKGLATAAIKAFLPWGFERFRLTRIFAITFVSNEASIRVLEKCGFEREGLMRKSAIKRGVIHDEYLYSVVR